MSKRKIREEKKKKTYQKRLHNTLLLYQTFDSYYTPILFK